MSVIEDPTELLRRPYDSHVNLAAGRTNHVFPLQVPQSQRIANESRRVLHTATDEIKERPFAKSIAREGPLNMPQKIMHKKQATSQLQLLPNTERQPQLSGLIRHAAMRKVLHLNKII